MKCLLVVLATMLTSICANALEIESAKLDAKKENIIVTVRHGGGCGDHTYALELQKCYESLPVQCEARIKHSTDDFCEAYLTREAVFNLKKYGLNAKYYSGASLKILGDENTKSVVVLPTFGSRTISTGSSKKVRCITHTGSDLLIGTEKVVLVTAKNETAEYQVVGTEVRSLESLPTIDQVTYKLNDGRSIQTKFTSGKTTGKGVFIRIDGSRSPEFNCQY